MALKASTIVLNRCSCGVLDMLQRFSCRGWESIQEGVAVVQRLDQELCCIFCEERPDPADVVEGKSAGLGHSSDAGGAGQSVVEDYAQVPRHCMSITVEDVMVSSSLWEAVENIEICAHTH